MKNSFRFLNIKNIIGIIFVLLGLCFNKKVLEIFFSPYAIIELNNRLPVFFVSLFFVLIGIGIIVLRKEQFSFSNIKDSYKYVAVTLFSAFLLFVASNVLVQAFYVVKDIYNYKSQIFLAYRKPLDSLYPGLNRKEIKELLYETWSRPYLYEPYTQFKERPFMGKYITVSEGGFRFSANQEPWPPSPDNVNVFFFGGSTAFGYGVRDEESISSYLQQILNSKFKNKKICLYNFGRGNYFSSQEKILFEKLLTYGFIPDIAVFMDGLNDFYYNDDEPLFTEKFEEFVAGKGTFLSGLPIIKIIKSRSDGYERFHRKEIKEQSYDDKELIASVVERYLKNKKAIETISKAFNVEPFFVWQPVPTYKYDLKYHVFAGKGFGRFMYSQYGYSFMEEFRKKNNLGKNFLWLADIQENIRKPLYIDIDHYSPEMSNIIANKISEFLLANAKVLKGGGHEQTIDTQRVLGLLKE